ncbi:MAG: Rne/Rng family ribonuclease [Bacteroidota bacterium]
MNNELIINSTSTEVTIALVEDGKLVELNNEKEDQSFSVGDIYLGRVRKIIPGLSAAFVDVGYERDAFLHYLDLGPQVLSVINFTKNTSTGKNPDHLLSNFTIEKEIEKTGKISNILTANQWVMVQVAKEPISTKGPRISTEISLAGRYMVLVPFEDSVSLSQKIKSSEERTRLKKLMLSIKPKNFGLIIRTAAVGKKVAELERDLHDMMAKWKSLHEQLLTAKPPQKLLGELNRTSTILRDLLNPNFQNIHVNDHGLYEEIKTYLRSIAPEHENIVKLYRGKENIFEHFGIGKQIKSGFGRTVNLPGGAYLVIEHTEALHVIDVNSGLRSKADVNQEENALAVNLEAAREVARQLRLRDMGGIIVIDFIDQRNAANRKILYEKIKEEMKKDRAKHNILPPSKFGLVQITRQRVRPEMNIVTVEKCPVCDGTGEIKASVLFIDDLVNNLKYLLKEQGEKAIKLRVSPYIYAYLTKGIISIRVKWFIDYKKWVKVIPDPAYHFMEYHFFNSSDEEIKLT